MTQPDRLQASVKEAYPSPFTILLSRLEVYINGQRILKVRI